MPTRAVEIRSSRTVPDSSTICPKARPVRAPSKREAKNRPPRKPDPSDTAEASIFRASTARTKLRSWAVEMSYCRAPWPADSTWGVNSARPPRSSPPRAGRRGVGTKRFLNSRSSSETPRISTTARAAQITPRVVNST